MKLYKTAGRAIINTMIQWDPNIKDLKQKWEILVKRKQHYVSEVPKISKELLIIKWTEDFANFLHCTVGKISIPLSYVIHESDTMPAVELFQPQMGKFT